MDMSIARARRDLLPGMGTALNGVNSTTPAAAAVSPLRTSDLRFVSYSFLPSGVSASSGLVRFEGDRMAAEVQRKRVPTRRTSLPAGSRPEVATFELRYFDGRIWYAAQDSDTMGRIPRAVEIKFSFHPPKRKPPLLNAAVSRSMDSFRSVILIPFQIHFPRNLFNENMVPKRQPDVRVPDTAQVSLTLELADSLKSTLRRGSVLLLVVVVIAMLTLAAYNSRSR